MSEWNRLKLITPAESTAVSLAEAKRHLRVLHDEDDDVISLAIEAATASIEGPNGIGICLMPQSWRLSLDHFPCEINIPLGPVTAITSISYTDADGDPATVSSWRTDFDSQPTKVRPARDTAWPSIVCEPGAVRVLFVAGYADVPADLKWALLFTIGHFYENRESVTTDLKTVELPLGIASILERYRVGRVA